MRIDVRIRLENRSEIDWSEQLAPLADFGARAWRNGQWVALGQLLDELKSIEWQDCHFMLRTGGVSRSIAEALRLCQVTEGCYVLQEMEVDWDNLWDDDDVSWRFIDFHEFVEVVWELSRFSSLRRGERPLDPQIQPEGRS